MISRRVPIQLYPLIGPFNFRIFSTSTGYDLDVDYYRRLGVKESATQVEIKRKFYELAKQHHPDAAISRKSDGEKFKQITAAYDILSNENLKRQYDASRVRYDKVKASHNS